MTTLYTNPDALAQHALSSPLAFNLGETAAYLDGDKIIEIAKRQGCKAIHPGYGFLSENSSFAERCKDAGIVFIGPPSSAIEDMGNKSRSKDIMTAAGVPCVPGYHGKNQDTAFLETEAEKIGFPVLLKAVKGGGGKGMRIARSRAEFQDQLKSAKSEAVNSFGDEAMLVEKYITTPRHLEVQIFADKYGNCVALGERDCSIQRRHQKILEESPAPHLEHSTRQELWEKARAAALAVGYEGAGTVEFIFDNDNGQFFFMEMNTRLQVEHPVTEMVTGQDLVHWQILVAEGGRLPLTQERIEEEIASRGHAIEARIYAENPEMGFIPDSGKLIHVRTPTPSADIRIDSGFLAGNEVSSHYDPMISKLIVRGATRYEAIRKLIMALESYDIAGPSTNIEFLKRVCQNEAFAAGHVETGFIDKQRPMLFAKETTTPEALAQAALATLLKSPASMPPEGAVGTVSVGFGSAFQQRQLSFTEATAPGGDDGQSFEIAAQQTGPDTFRVKVNGWEVSQVRAHFDEAGKTLTSFFPHRRLDSTVVFDGEKVTVFQEGRQYRLLNSRLKWFEKALGIKEVGNSVLAPMPCKILRLEVEEGAEVKKDQPLVVIESMKMETVIRSPQDGRIAKIVHQAGVGFIANVSISTMADGAQEICKAGTALVEFVDPGS